MPPPCEGEGEGEEAEDDKKCVDAVGMMCHLL